MVNTLFLPELREMLADANRAELEEFCTTLNAGRTAEFMEGLSNDEIWQVLQYATPERRAEIFAYFDEERQVEMLEAHETAEVAELVEEIPADDRVDLLQELPDQRVDEILPLLPVEDRRDIQRLQSFPEGTAGALMTSEVAKKFPSACPTGMRKISPGLHEHVTGESACSPQYPDHDPRQRGSGPRQDRPGRAGA